MKILYHHRTASRDGQSTHIQEMIAGLRSIGCEVEESAPSIVEANPAGGSGGWVGKLKAFLPGGLYELAELAYSFVAYRRLAGKIKACKPHGIYERYNLYFLAGIWAKKKYGLPLILEVNAPMALERRQYGGLYWPRLADWTERYVWRNADIILPVTQVLAEHIISRGVAPSRVVVIPNGINEDHYRSLPTTDEAKLRLGLSGKLVIGFTGFVREWDRLDRIMRWIARQPAEVGAYLLVVGDGPARKEIEDCARASMNLTGWVSLALFGEKKFRHSPWLSISHYKQRLCLTLRRFASSNIWPCQKRLSRPTSPIIMKFSQIVWIPSCMIQMTIKESKKLWMPCVQTSCCERKLLVKQSR